MEKTSGINWSISKPEHETIQKIVTRLFETGMLPKHRVIDTLMDITACHLNGNALDLDALLAAPMGEFLHDVCGILNNIDRETGKLLNCFSPRYSQS